MNTSYVRAEVVENINEEGCKHRCAVIVRVSGSCTVGSLTY